METQRLLRIGNALLSGPHSIYPAGEDRHFYLEATVSVRWHSETFSDWRSVRIYCDANGSDEEGFLDPMVRFAFWHREKDIFVLRPRWPSVSIELAELPADSSDLQDVVRKLQATAGQAPFVPHGLPTCRNFGEYPGDEGGHITVEVSSGWQQMVRSVQVTEAPALYETVVILEQSLRRLALPVERGAWLERYDRSPDEMLESRSWYWNGQPLSV